MAEFTPTEDGEGVVWGATPWVISINNSSNKHVGGVGVILNHQRVTKYKAFLASLDLAKVARASSMVIRCDS